MPALLIAPVCEQRRNIAMTLEEIKELLTPPVITPAKLLESKILPVGRNSLYEALKTGEIAAMKVGKKKLILTAPLRQQLGI
jgi:hypothetical protein